jgi:toxin HigB-1
LALLETIESIEEMDIPGYRLHQLSGKLSDFWSVKVNANYRIIFRFEDGNVYDVDYLDYH